MRAAVGAAAAARANPLARRGGGPSPSAARRGCRSGSRRAGARRPAAAAMSFTDTPAGPCSSTRSHAACRTRRGSRLRSVLDTCQRRWYTFDTCQGGCRVRRLTHRSAVVLDARPTLIDGTSGRAGAARGAGPRAWRRLLTLRAVRRPGRARALGAEHPAVGRRRARRDAGRRRRDRRHPAAAPRELSAQLASSGASVVVTLPSLAEDAGRRARAT